MLLRGELLLQFQRPDGGRVLGGDVPEGGHNTKSRHKGIDGHVKPYTLFLCFIPRASASGSASVLWGVGPLCRRCVRFTVYE